MKIVIVKILQNSLFIYETDGLDTDDYKGYLIFQASLGTTQKLRDSQPVSKGKRLLSPLLPVLDKLGDSRVLLPPEVSRILTIQHHKAYQLPIEYIAEH